MIISFKPRFVKKILNGTKIHTIREAAYNRYPPARPNRWQPGRIMHMATGIRTKNYNCFKEAVCKSIQKIVIIYEWNYGDSLRIIVDDKELPDEKIKELVRNDGFIGRGEFIDWFFPNRRTPGGCSAFNGNLIHWTDFKY